MKRLVKESLYESSVSGKKGFEANIEQETLDNENFRKVLYTGKNMQLVLMTLQPEENIGLEVHENDQFFRFESGKGQVIINETTYNVSDGSGIIIPAGAKHDIINTGNKVLQMYTLYSPPHHKDGIVHNTKESAVEEEFDGKITE